MSDICKNEPRRVGIHSCSLCSFIGRFDLRDVAVQNVHHYADCWKIFLPLKLFGSICTRLSPPQYCSVVLFHHVQHWKVGTSKSKILCSSVSGHAQPRQYLTCKNFTACGHDLAVFQGMIVTVSEFSPTLLSKSSVILGMKNLWLVSAFEIILIKSRRGSVPRRRQACFQNTFPLQSAPNRALPTHSLPKRLLYGTYSPLSYRFLACPRFTTG